MKSHRHTLRRNCPQLESLEARTLLSAVPISYADSVKNVALDSGGNVYASFSFSNTLDIDPGSGQTWLSAPSGGTGWALAKYTTAGSLAAMTDGSGRPWVQQPGFGFFYFAFDAADNVYVGGAQAKVEAYAADGHSLWRQDPTLSAGANSGTFGVAADSTGVYTAGYINSGSVDFGSDSDGSDQTLYSTAQTGQIAYVAKRGFDGSLLWVKSLGGTVSASVSGLASDGTSVYVSGMFDGTILQGTTFPMTNTPSSPYDAYVLKISPDGTFLAADHYQDLTVDALAADGSGLYAVGTINDVVPSDLDPGTGQTLLYPANGTGFVTRLTSDLGLTWVKQAAVGPLDLALAGGHVYITGGFSGTVDFDPGASQFPLTAAGASDIFVWDLMAADGAFSWAGRMGGSNPTLLGDWAGDAGVAIAADAGGIYTGGQFLWGQADFDPGPSTAILSTGADTDGFVSKLTPAGTYAWAIQVGGYVGTIDDGDTGYAEVGHNWKNYTSGGFQGDARTAKAGSGTNTATWTFTGLPDGSYDVLATWKENRQNASTARYTLNGVAAPSVNQQIAPGDIQNGSLWKKLGNVVVTGGRLTVVLSDQANGNIVADAIRVVATGASGAAPGTAMALRNTDGPSASLPSRDATRPIVRETFARWQPPIAVAAPDNAVLQIGQVPDQVSTGAITAGSEAGSPFAPHKIRRPFSFL